MTFFVLALFAWWLAGRWSRLPVAHACASLASDPRASRSHLHEQGDDHLLDGPRHARGHSRGGSVRQVFIERENQRGVVGNLYKGRVSKVLPGMQSSFIDIGLERDAFLYVSEVVNTVEEFER